MTVRLCLLLILGIAAPLHAEPVSATFPGKQSLWEGYARFDFPVDGVNVIVVTPKQAAAGNPWVWRAEFFGHQPNTDIALLGRGFHIVHVAVGNTFGCPDAMKHFDAAYQVLTEEHGLAKKVAFEGLSRGGLYSYNWAAANPDKVACIYGDAPVCDFKSWPGGKGKGKGSPGDWKKLLADYHFASEEEALKYDKNPIDNLKPLADAHVPLLHVCGDADKTVPYEENTAIMKERYEKLGGTMEVILKKGVDHHPHGLTDPTPIVEFIVKYAWAGK